MKFLKNKWKFVIIIGLLIIPILYSFFYLKAFWNPYGNLKDLKVAVVNLDNNEQGNKLTKEIINNDTMKFIETSENKANKGLNNKEYYAIITIPKDFTEKIDKVKKGDYETAKIVYSPNQKTNYLASQIINKAITKIEKNLILSIDSNVVTSLKENLDNTPSSLDSINSGFNTIKTNLKTLSNGTNTLSNGTNELKTNYIKFNEGISSLNKNYNEFNNGVNEVNKGSNDLLNGIKSLNNGIETLSLKTESFDTVNDSLNSLETGVDNLNSGINNYVTGVNSYLTNVSNYCNEMQFDPMQTDQTSPLFSLCYQTNLLKDLSNQASLTYNGQMLTTKSTYLNTNVNQNIPVLINNLNQLNIAISKLKKGSNSLLNGANKLNSGINTLNDNSHKILDGTNELNNNSKLLVNGINNLDSGANKLNNGTNLLYSGVNDSIIKLDNKISDVKNDISKLKGIDNYTSNPVEIEEKDVNRVDEYGVAFAPYFISISLWVGSLVLLIVLLFDLRDRFKLFSRNNKTYKRTIGYYVLATLQAIILGIVLKFALGYSVTNYLLYFIGLIVIANCFMSILQFLIYAFDDIGKFLAIVIMVLQLAACAGTFPIETVPIVFQKISPLMPMTYSVNLVKEIIISTTNNFYLTNCLVLLGITVFFTVLISIVNIITKKKSK